MYSTLTICIFIASYVSRETLSHNPGLESFGYLKRVIVTPAVFQFEIALFLEKRLRNLLTCIFFNLMMLFKIAGPFNPDCKRIFIFLLSFTFCLNFVLSLNCWTSDDHIDLLNKI
jgi:hypothetical protein